jgi:hypothetical protein
MIWLISFGAVTAALVCLMILFCALVRFIAKVVTDTVTQNQTIGGSKGLFIGLSKHPLNLTISILAWDIKILCSEIVILPKEAKTPPPPRPSHQALPWQTFLLIHTGLSRMASTT